MENKIIVAGAGHGGIVAAYYLAQNGYNVTVYEKQRREDLGYDQVDSIHLDGFELSGIPVPEKYRVKRTPLAFCLPGTDIEPLVQADSGDTYNVEIDRKALYNYLITLAEYAGVNFVFECEVIRPIVLGSRVVGIKTSEGDLFAPLIIDACGMYSPLRMNLPDFMGIQKMPGKYDILETYRVCLNINADAPKPELRYMVSLLPHDFCGLSWLITNDDHVDILVASFKEVAKEKIDEVIDGYREVYPHVGTEIISGGNIVHIPVRYPLSVMVADGYAAIGDSAFMTVPLKGSGIGYSMRAGKILADCIMEDENGLYNREKLWKYEVDFYENIGFTASMLAVVKGLFPLLTIEDVEYCFKENIVSSEDMAAFGSEAGLMKIITSLNPASLTKKARKAIGHPNVRKLLTSIVKNITRYMIAERSFPHKYNSADIEKWSRNFDRYFDSIRYKEEDFTEGTDDDEALNED